MTTAAALLLAWGIDRRFGEPGNRWHPVAWFGRAMGPLGRALPSLPPALAFSGGALAWLLGVGGIALLAAWLQTWLLALPWWLAVPLLGLALKPTMAWRMLADEVHGVERAQRHGLEAARRQVARLCSRDVATLDAAGVRETALESLAENFNDALVAPLFWFVVAGLPGAWAWRAVNTLDAMWGYRGRWAWAGKVAARADDAMAWLPARLAALLLWAPGIGWRRLRDEAGRTPSPNGGWPMACLALRLGVRLGKPGVYTLHADGRAPEARDTASALRLTGRAAWLAVALGLAIVLAGSLLSGPFALLATAPGWWP